MKPLDDDEVSQFAGQLLAQVKGLSAEVAALPAPQPGSSLGRDDDLAAPFKPSQVTRRALANATEHLDALRMLLVEVGVQHPAVPFTLLRAAIETAATAIWVLDPQGRRPERVLRALRLALKEASDQNRLEVTMGSTPSRPFADRKARILEVAGGGIGPDTKVTQPTSKEIVESAEASTGRNVGLYAAWQICSGFAHGRLWSTLAVQDREAVSESDDGDLMLRITGSTKALTWALTLSITAVMQGAELYRKRATSPHSNL